MFEIDMTIFTCQDLQLEFYFLIHKNLHNFNMYAFNEN